jgi:hypothetical protein
MDEGRLSVSICIKSDRLMCSLALNIILFESTQEADGGLAAVEDSDSHGLSPITTNASA